MPDISKINALAIGSVGKVDGLAKASILDIDGVAIPSVPPPLDTYTGAAVAYSVRLLRTAYTGHIMRVRRASDNVEADVGFDGGELKLTSPISNTSDAQSYTDFADFVDHTGTPTDAFCRYWYDQSGNGIDAGQSTSGSQPKIYDSSVPDFIKDNNKPAIRFKNQDDSGVNRWFDAGDNGDTTGDISVFSVLNHNNEELSKYFGGPITKTVFAAGTNRFAIQPTRIFYVDSANSATTVINLTTQNTQILHSCIVIGASSITMYENGVAETNTGSPTGSVGNSSYHLLVGGYGDASGTGGAWDSMRGIMQEVIYYASNKSSVQSNIEDNLNAFFGIY